MCYLVIAYNEHIRKHAPIEPKRLHLPSSWAEVLQNAIQNMEGESYEDAILEMKRSEVVTYFALDNTLLKIAKNFGTKKSRSYREVDTLG